MRTKQEEYIDRLSQQLTEWSSLIDELESRMAGATAGKGHYELRIRDLRIKRDALSLKLQELGAASGEAGKALMVGVEAAKKELRDAISLARDKFKQAA